MGGDPQDHRRDRSAQGLKKGYQLDAYRSFFLAGLGRAADADDCLLKAIEANPHLLNCYQRLGDDHFRAFDTVDAWRCFDAIRRIDPDYFMLKNVKVSSAVPEGLSRRLLILLLSGIVAVTARRASNGTRQGE